MLKSGVRANITYSNNVQKVNLLEFGLVVCLFVHYFKPSQIYFRLESLVDLLQVAATKYFNDIISDKEISFKCTQYSGVVQFSALNRSQNVVRQPVSYGPKLPWLSYCVSLPQLYRTLNIVHTVVQLRSQILT